MPGGTQGPHLSLVLPYAFVNERLSARVRALPAVPLEAPLPGLPKLKLVPKAVALQPARADRAGFRIDFAVRDGGGDLVDLGLDVEVKPVIDAKRRTVALAVRPDDLRGVEPVLGAEAKRQLGDALYDLLPSAVKAIGGKDVATDAAGDLLKTVVKQGWPLMRDHLLSHLDEVARFELALGDLPLERLALRDERGALRFDVWTSLPGAGGLTQSKNAANRPQLRVSGATVAALGNWAMDTGRVAPRYDAKGKPEKDGAYLPAVRWRPGESRPLAVHVFATKGECLHAELSAIPKVSLVTEKGRPQLRVGVEQGTLEHVEGPLLIEIGAWLRSLWAESIDVTHDVAADTKLSLPGGDWTMGLAAARVEGDVVVLDLDVDPVKP
jgi:hypothetical protein